MWFKELAGIGDTKANLAAAADGENFEWTDMYENFAKTAEASVYAINLSVYGHMSVSFDMLVSDQ